ncbi:hypothetical protein WG66_009500 [Moniliophthora roreri]|nr:hypothetical protein WG66_009500 [Moniliophthora roreri]
MDDNDESGNIKDRAIPGTQKEPLPSFSFREERKCYANHRAVSHLAFRHRNEGGPGARVSRATFQNGNGVGIYKENLPRRWGYITVSDGAPSETDVHDDEFGNIKERFVFHIVGASLEIYRVAGPRLPLKWLLITVERLDYDSVVLLPGRMSITVATPSKSFTFICYLFAIYLDLEIKMHLFLRCQRFASIP